MPKRVNKAKPRRTTGSRAKSRRSAAKPESKRLTITLGPGQRRALEAIARANNVSLALITRYALDEFIKQHRTHKLRLSFAPTKEIE